MRELGLEGEALLLAAPAGPKAVMGLDPGIRTGVKVAVVDATGKLLETSTVYPHEPRKDWDGSLHTLQLLAQKHSVELIAIGNGTASRETDKLAGDLIKMLLKDEHSAQEIQRIDAQKGAQNAPKIIQKVVVSESGASIYSASEYASQEMPDVDVSLRGAASIARRLQDPLAELVKIEPKSIGVGQYQHDVNQSELVKSLDAVVEDCVNGVGVDLNTASVPLLSRVAGLSGSVAKSVVRHREANGAFKSRADLLAVSGLGAKTFEQCAGFLRIQGGSNPLDATGVHPESYEVVEKLLALVKKPITEVMGRSELLKGIKPEQIVTGKAGALTVTDILAELEKPGRDPRGSFVAARLSDGIEDIKHLVVGMVLEGTVSNVAVFGAFVDLGVHQDGLIHVSQLSHKFITDAREVVRAGQVVIVKVTEVDVARKRIALSMKLDAAPAKSFGDRNDRGSRDNRGAVNTYRPKQEEVRNSSMADKLAALKR
jgi:protein Tex